MECEFKIGDIVVRDSGPRHQQSLQAVEVKKVERITQRIAESRLSTTRSKYKVRFKLTVVDYTGFEVHWAIPRDSRAYRLATPKEIKESGFKKQEIKKTINMQVVKQEKVKINGKLRNLTIVVLISEGQVRGGYSVKNPEDKDNETLAIAIARGRAMSDRTNLLDMCIGIGMDKKFILYSIAEHLIRKIKGGSIKIKGVK